MKYIKLLIVVAAISSVMLILTSKASTTYSYDKNTAEESSECTEEVTESNNDYKVIMNAKIESESETSCDIEEASLVESDTYIPDSNDVYILTQLLWGEARGVESDMEKSAVIWCVLNRVDSDEYPDDIVSVVTQYHQFSGYNSSYPAPDDLRELVTDVLIRYHNENNGCNDVGRTLPSDYLYFTGDGSHNYFRKDYKDSSKWNWSFTNPYED